jgi:hypothetical protein
MLEDNKESTKSSGNGSSRVAPQAAQGRLPILPSLEVSQSARTAAAPGSVRGGSIPAAKGCGVDLSSACWGHWRPTAAAGEQRPELAASVSRAASPDLGRPLFLLAVRQLFGGGRGGSGDPLPGSCGSPARCGCGWRSAQRCARLGWLVHKCSSSSSTGAWRTPGRQPKVF